MKKAVRELSIIYLCFLILLWAFLRFQCDQNWLATAIQFSPLWPLLLPFLVLIPWQLCVRPVAVFFYIIPIGLILFPIMGYELPLHSVPKNAVVSLKIMTCNAGGLRRTQEWLELVRKEEIQVVLLQECEQAKAKEIFEELGWNYQHHSQLAIGSAMPLSDSKVLARHDAEHYNAAAALTCSINIPITSESISTTQEVHLISIHLPTPRPGLQELVDHGIGGIDSITNVNTYRANLSHEIAQALKEIDGEKIFGGDFNMPQTSRIYQADWSRYKNAFSYAGTGFGFSKHTRYHGIRIDHLLSDTIWNAKSAKVGPSNGGDHRPLIVELVRAP